MQDNLFGSSDKTEIKSHRKWAEVIKTRDEYECIHAKKDKHRNHKIFNKEAHHIMPKKYGGKNFLNNGITLCKACHAAQHPEHEQLYYLPLLNRIYILVKDFLKTIVGLSSDLKYFKLLKFLTGSNSFRKFQKEIIRTIAEQKKHVFVVMPTGSGKSILYQIPGLLDFDKNTLVMTPLKALQEDQVYKLKSKWIPATYIHSGLDKTEQDGRKKWLLKNGYEFLFIHPKQILHYDKETNTSNVKGTNSIIQSRFDYLVIDEVHVIKSFGLSFVPEYFDLKKIFTLFNKPQLILLTASASADLRKEIIKNLGLDEDKIKQFVHGFKRPEIELSIIKANTEIDDKYVHKDKLLFELLNTYDTQNKVLIFCTTTKQVDDVFHILESSGKKVTKYHSKMAKEKREISQRLYQGIMKPESNIMVATSAFGMGIDIPNIRTVIHYSMPFTLTDYYQQIGRAGRDGMKSKAVLILDKKERFSVIDFINKKTLESVNNSDLRDKMEDYFENERNHFNRYIDANDKWEYITSYFGEEEDSNFLKGLLIIFIAVLGYLLVKYVIFY